MINKTGISFIVMAIAVGPAVGNDEEIRQQFRRDYSQPGEALLKHYGNVHTRWTTTYPFPDGRASISSVDGRFNRDNYLLKGTSWTAEVGKHLDEPSQHVSISVEGRNKQYGFSLDSGKDGQHLLSKVTMFDSPGTTDNQKAACVMGAPFGDYIRRMTFIDMARDNETHFLAYEDCVWQGRPAKKLRVQYQRRDRKTNQMVTAESCFFFSPQEGWVCVGELFHPDVAQNNAAHAERRYSYSAAGLELPRLKRMEDWVHDPGNPVTDRMLMCTDVLEYAPVAPIPEAEFRLTKFGLPEPEGLVWEKPRKSRTWIWLIVAAAVSGLLTLGLLRLKRYLAEKEAAA